MSYTSRCPIYPDVLYIQMFYISRCRIYQMSYISDVLYIQMSHIFSGGPERMGPHPPPWVPLLKNVIVVAVSFPPV